MTPIRQLYGEDFIIDETIWHGRVEDGQLDCGHFKRRGVKEDV